jgi:hypothetical protein
MSEDKVGEVMSLVGIPARDAAAARSNLEKLQSVELDSYLQALRSGEDTIAKWRATRGSSILEERATATSVRGVDSPISQKTDYASAVAAVTRGERELEHLAHALEKFGPHEGRRLLGNIERQHAGVARSFSENVMKASEDRPVSTESKESSERIDRFVTRQLSKIEVLELTAASVARPEISNILSHPVLPVNRNWLSTANTLDALARVINAISKRPADLIVAVNEGLSVAQVVKGHLGLKADIVIVKGDNKNGLVFDNTSVFENKSFSTIWVVGHLARTGSTLIQTMAEARIRFNTDTVFGAVLAASMEAAENLTEIYYHQLAPSSLIRL